MRRFDETVMKVPKLLLPGLCLMASMASSQKFDPRILNQLEWTKHRSGGYGRPHFRD